MKITMVPTDRIIKDPNNPRKAFSAERRNELSASIKLYGIKVPLIGYGASDRVMLADGHGRFDGAMAASLAEVPVIILAEKPSEAELLVTQLTLNGHRQALNPVDEFESFSKLISFNNWSPSQLATALTIGQAEITRVMAIGKLSPQEREQVRCGKISKSAAYALSRMPADQRAATLPKVIAGEVTRDQLNSQARKKRTASNTSKNRRVCCELPGATISMQSDIGLSLPSVIDLLEELIRECRKARSQGLDISTAVRVMRDRCRAQVAS